MAAQYGGLTLALCLSLEVALLAGLGLCFGGEVGGWGIFPSLVSKLGS